MSVDFWINVAVLAGIYGIFTLGLQLNTGFTGLLNFGQAGFMAIGAYTLGILVVDWGWSLWPAMAAGVVLAVAATWPQLLRLPPLHTLQPEESAVPEAEIRHAV